MAYEGDLYRWIREREKIRLAREVEKLPPPWTHDPVMRTTRFCNIRREDDKVTRWIKINWRDPYKFHPHLAFAMCVARVVNLPESLEYLGFPEVWAHDRFVTKMDTLSDGGRNKIWTAAYMVTGGYSKGGETKQEIMARVLDDAYPHAKRVHHDMSLEEAHKEISRTSGLGTFLAAQVIADLKYTPLLCDSTDWWSFCSPGPGSTMGLNLLAGRDPKKYLTPAQFSQEVNLLRPIIQERTGYDLTAHDTQNCLCEFSKYVRIKYLGGRAKTQFKEPK